MGGGKMGGEGRWEERGGGKMGGEGRWEERGGEGMGEKGEGRRKKGEEEGVNADYANSSMNDHYQYRQLLTRSSTRA